MSLATTCKNSSKSSSTSTTIPSISSALASTSTTSTTTPSRMANSIIIYSALFVLTLATLLTLNQSPVECHMIKRTQYHEQGLHGPKSYKFGYTSGDEKNPQERHEVSDGHGHVKGWYSFVDASGKYQVIHYEAHPKYGFKVYNHKSKSYNNGKRHYGV